MSKKMATECFSEAGWTRRAAHIPVFPAQVLAFLARRLIWPCPLHQDRYNYWDSGSTEVIPDTISEANS